MIRSARDDVSACASELATTKSTPDRPEAIMLLTALPPAPPTPHTMMRGFNSLSWGVFRLIGIPCLSLWASADAVFYPSGRKPESSGNRLQPAPTCDARQAPSRLSFCRAGTRSDSLRDCRAPFLKGGLLALMVNIRFIRVGNFRVGSKGIRREAEAGRPARPGRGALRAS